MKIQNYFTVILKACIFSLHASVLNVSCMSEPYLPIYK